MIRIQREGPACVTLKGHAGSDVYGRDLVCAGVSALALTLGETAAALPGAEVTLRPGDSSIRCAPEAKAVAAFDCVCGGFALLARKYPGFISFSQVKSSVSGGEKTF